jgi:hypothetical protein
MFNDNDVDVVLNEQFKRCKSAARSAARSTK